jgi:Flp pilus assembly protein TadG
MKLTITNQRGVIMVIFALSLAVLLGFVALGIEAGRWYLMRAELSKAVDAAALAGAANIATPNIDLAALAVDFGNANFSPGHVGTPTTGTGAISFSATYDSNTFSVTGNASAVGLLSQLFGVESVAGTASGSAQKNHVQIMMVLDRSGSMSGAMNDLKTAAGMPGGFVGFFQDTQADDQMGLVTFATGVTVNVTLRNNFVTPIQTVISAMSSSGHTNTEDAISQAGNALPDQTGMANASRKQQFLILFTDGHPTAFRSIFAMNGNSYDAVVSSASNCNSTSESINATMGYNNSEATYSTSTLAPTPTGDGKTTGATVCATGGGKNKKGYVTTKWGSFPAYPVPGMGAVSYPAYCSIPTSALSGSDGYLCITARQMGIDNAAALKARGVMIYTIGLGDVDADFLNAVASGSNYVAITPNSSELQAIFNRIAKNIKLRLVQ